MTHMPSPMEQVHGTGILTPSVAKPLRIMERRRDAHFRPE